MIAQFQILNKVLETGDISLITLNNLDEKFFNESKAEYNYIKTHKERYGNVPDTVTFKGVFPDFQITKVNEPDTYLLEQLYNDYNDGYMANRFNRLKTLLENGESEKARDYFLKSVEGLENGSGMSYTSLFANTNRYDEYVDRATNKKAYSLSTGLPELDAVIGGIDRKDENFVIVARTGVGKSWTLCLLAAAASKQGLKVGIYEGEMSASKLGYRIDTMLGHIDNWGLKCGDLSIQKEYKQYLESLPKSGYGDILILTPNDIPGGHATVDALQAFIDKTHIDILFIDQYSLLEDTSGAKAENEKIANISKAVKKLQVRNKIPMVSVSQLNRQKDEKDKNNIDSTMIFGSDRIGQDATVILALRRKDDRLIYKVVKARDGGTDTELEYVVDLNRGIFNYIPSEKDKVTTQADFENMADQFVPQDSEDEEAVEDEYADLPF